MLGAGEQVVLTLGARLQRPVAGGDQAIDIGEGRGAVESELIEGAGGGKRLQRALVDQARVDAPGEVRDVTKSAPNLSLLGDVLQIESNYLQSWLLAPSLGGDPRRHVWRLDRRVAGSGALGDLGSHQIDLAHHLVGPIRRVTALLETKARRSPVPGAVGT